MQRAPHWPLQRNLSYLPRSTAIPGAELAGSRLRKAAAQTPRFDFPPAQTTDTVHRMALSWEGPRAPWRPGSGLPWSAAAHLPRRLSCLGSVSASPLSERPFLGVRLLHSALCTTHSSAEAGMGGGAQLLSLCVLSRPHVGVQGGHSYAPQDSRFLDLLFCDLLPAGGSVFGLQGR